MTNSEIYKILSFEKTKIDYNKIIMSTKNNLIIVTSSVK
jgi:sialic acid synthase SpsE